MREETLFELAANAPEAERAALLDRECDGNPELRASLVVDPEVLAVREVVRNQPVADVGDERAEGVSPPRRGGPWSGSAPQGRSSCPGPNR